jgi:hypothetical protein
MSTKPKPTSQRSNARQRARQRAEQQRKQQRRRLLLIGGGSLAVVLVLLVGATLLIYQHIHTTATTQQLTTDALAVDGVQCQTTEALSYHIHAHLTLYQDGSPITLPANIGIPVGSAVPAGTCYYWLHVHDTTGVVHIESPTTQQYTLGQFLDVWQRTAQLDAQGGASPVDDAFVRALKAANPSDIHIYVGDKQVSDYAGISLTAHELITIEIGAPTVPPVTNYTFPAGE